jgi:hypothetical protein
MGEITMPALTPLKQETMINHFEEDPDLLERRSVAAVWPIDLLETSLTTLKQIPTMPRTKLPRRKSKLARKSARTRTPAR